MESREIHDAQSLRSQAERARRLARDSTDPVLAEQLTKAAAEFMARADAAEKLVPHQKK